MKWIGLGDVIGAAFVVKTCMTKLAPCGLGQCCSLLNVRFSILDVCDPILVWEESQRKRCFCINWMLRTVLILGFTISRVVYTNTDLLYVVDFQLNGIGIVRS